jgi:hypothetical protein
VLCRSKGRQLAIDLPSIIARQAGRQAAAQVASYNLLAYSVAGVMFNLLCNSKGCQLAIDFFQCTHH